VNLLRDVRYALHTLRTSPSYTLMCVGVLALGIGANAAIFSVLNGVILNALPYPEPQRLVFVWERFPGLPAPVGDRMQVRRSNYRAWKIQTGSFAAMEAVSGRTLPLESGTPRNVSTAFASAGLFRMLGVQAHIGRLFTAAEDRRGADGVAVLSDSFFDQRFHRDPKALGQSLTLGGSAYTVIGVLPPRFHLPSTNEGEDQLTPDVWVPFSRLAQIDADEHAHQLYVAARLKRGASLAQARREMASVAERLQKSDPKFNQGWTTAVFPFSVEDSGAELHLAIYVLMGAVGFLLLIACANLANLTMARAALRGREVAVRLALGATRGRIVAQLVTEAILVSLAGAALGLLLAHWCVQGMLALKPEDIQRPELIEVNFPVFAFAAAAGVFTAILFGLLPSWTASRADLSMALKSGAWGASAARVRSRQFLIAVEVALALMLLTGAGLMVRSFRELIATGVGFDTTRLTLMDLELPAKQYSDGATQSRFFHAAVERLRAIPGVTAAAAVDNMPLHTLSFANFNIAGRPDPPLDALPIADMARVSPGYFSAIGLRLESGRWFTDRDIELTEAGGHRVAAVNAAFVRKFFSNEEPLGKLLTNGDHQQASEIVAVVSDYRAMGAENGTRPTIFWPTLQFPRATLLVRSAATEQTVAAGMRSAIGSLDRNLASSEVRSMQYYVDEWLSQRKFNTLLLGIFAGLALLLGMMGIYGVLSNLVASRVREIGIRMAIGASPRNIAGLVLRQSLVPVAMGLAAGLGGSLALSRFLEALLFQIRPRDPLTLALAASSVLLISPAAIYWPLRRATRVDCTVSLREE
jgi:putative ABC transport system permease protein